MALIFDALPGLPVAVGSIGRGLADMWGQSAAQGKPAPASEDSKAMQVNLVLHLGLNAEVEDAVAMFQVAVNFSRRYPSRVVVLCPQAGEEGPAEIRAKVYGECTLGKSKDDTRCCEFVLLGYPPSLRQYLENQVSVCLSTDLPLCYWAHRFAASSRLADYHYLLTRSKRVLFDSATAPSDAMSYPWPKPESVRDLAYARLLPVRQSVGQFLSRYPFSALCGGLRTVSLAHGSNLAAEGKVFLGWVKDRITQCGENRAQFALGSPAGQPAGALELTFDYGGAKAFSWKGDLASGLATFEADFGTGRTRLPAAISLLAPENALSEAMFF